MADCSVGPACFVGHKDARGSFPAGMDMGFPLLGRIAAHCLASITLACSWELPFPLDDVCACICESFSHLLFSSGQNPELIVSGMLSKNVSSLWQIVSLFSIDVVVGALIIRPIFNPTWKLQGALNRHDRRPFLVAVSMTVGELWRKP